MPRPATVPPGPPLRRGGLRSLPYYYRFATDPLGVVAERFDRYGDIYYAPSDGTGLYVLRHPDHIRQVLATRASKFRKTHSAFERMQRVLGQGLLTADGDTWKRHRRMIQPAFARSRLRGYAEVMVEEAVRAASRMATHDVVDASAQMVELTLRVVSRTLFSHDVADDSDDVAGAMRTFNRTMGRPDLLPAWAPSPTRRRLERAVERLDRIVLGLVDARRAAVDAGHRDLPEDLLQRLVTAVDEDGDGGGLSRTEVRDELVTLFLAGHETTSHALSWTWLLLSQNPGIREQLHAELDAVLGGRAPTFDDLEHLPLTKQVLEESMRLYPPAFVLARKAIEDTEIGGYEVPAGSEVVVWTYMTHRDPRWFPEPRIFRPSRFQPESFAQLPKMAYLPFGGGPRACIGASFSLLEAHLLLATLASRLRFDLVAGRRIEPAPGVTLAPRGGLPMHVSVRRPGHADLPSP